MPICLAAACRPKAALLTISPYRNFLNTVWTILEIRRKSKRRELVALEAPSARARPMVRLVMVRLGMAKGEDTIADYCAMAAVRRRRRAAQATPIG